MLARSPHAHARLRGRAQAELRKEAAASAIEEQLKDKEATEADNAANLAKLAEHEALVRASTLPYRRARPRARLGHEPGAARVCSGCMVVVRAGCL